VGFGAILPAGSWVERRLIMPQGKHVRPQRGDTVVGGMIYKPLDASPQGLGTVQEAPGRPPEERESGGRSAEG